MTKPWSRISPRKGRRWDKLAMKIRERDDYECQVCGDYGYEVDHIVPIQHGGAMWDWDNLQCICQGCHIEKTRKEVRNFARGGEEWYDEWKRLKKELANGHHRD